MTKTLLPLALMLAVLALVPETAPAQRSPCNPAVQICR